jgi:hypothetical protein
MLAMKPARVAPAGAFGWLTLLGGLLLLAAGCHLDDPTEIPEEKHVVRLLASPRTLVLPAIGSTHDVTVTAYFSDSSTADVTELAGTFYSSTNTMVAGADLGVIWAAGDGFTNVIVEREAASDTIAVTVNENSPLAVVRLSADPDSLTLGSSSAASIGGEAVWINGARLVATGLPFSYGSSDESVATASVSGLVSAVAPGTAVVSLSFREFIAEVPVTVLLPASTVSFAADVLPILQAACAFSGCHGSTGVAQAGLRLASYEQVMAGADSGAVVLPLNGPESRIIRSLRGTLQGTLQMPLGAPPLAEISIESIEDWIDEGALDN